MYQPPTHDEVQTLQYCNKVHKFKYRYSVKHTKRDISGNVQLAITCPFHGNFYLPLKRHKSGVGCPKCEPLGNRITFDTFLAYAKKVHGTTYQYYKFDSTRRNGKVKIKCKHHGDFYQGIFAHLHGSGCQDCAKGIRSVEQFLRDANHIHKRRYTYEDLGSKNVPKDVTVVCHLHGKFKQSVQSHLGGAGCRNCSYTDPYFYIYLFSIKKGRKRFYKLGLSNDVSRREKELRRALKVGYEIELMDHKKYKNLYGAFTTEYFFLSQVPGSPVSKKIMPDGYAESKDNGLTMKAMQTLFDKLDRSYRRVHRAYNPDRQMYASSENGKRRMERRRKRQAAKRKNRNNKLTR